MIPLHSTDPAAQGCGACHTGEELGFDFEYAYQPIVDVAARTIYAHEALVRGPNGEGAFSILERVNDSNRYQFDQACRVKAIRGAAALGMQELLSINFLPNAVYRPDACIRTTLAAARECNFPLENIIFEVTESEQVMDRAHLVNIFHEYRRFGFHTAIDDFGAGYAGLNLLSSFQPSLLKLDMDLVRDIDSHAAKQVIVKGVVSICHALGVRVLAEGVETAAERDHLRAAGISLMQGYWFCRPAFKALGTIPDEAWG